MRYVLYDKNTGSILHTHQVFKLGTDEPQEPTEDDLRLVISRFPEPEKLDLTKTTLSPVSSRQAEMTVDLKTREVMAKPLVADALSRRITELRGKTPKKED